MSCSDFNARWICDNDDACWIWDNDEQCVSTVRWMRHSTDPTGCFADAHRRWYWSDAELLAVAMHPVDRMWRQRDQQHVYTDSGSLLVSSKKRNVISEFGLKKLIRYIQPGRRTLRSLSSSRLLAYLPSGSQQSAAGSSQLLVPVSGTPCRKRRHQHRHWRFSVDVWKHTFSNNIFLILLSDPTSL